MAQLLFERKIKYQTELSATEVESRLRALISGDDKQTRDLQGKISPGEFLLYRAQQANFKFSLLLKGKVKVEGSILVVEVTYTIEKKLRRKIYLTFCLLVAILVVFKWQGLHLSPSIKYDELFALSGSVFVLGLMFSLFERETGCFSVLLSRQLELQEMKLPE